MALNRYNYFSASNNMKYMSASQYKSFLSCEAATLAELKGEWEHNKSEALIQGSYVDAYFEGSIESFKAEHPELFNTRTGNLLAKFSHLNYIISRIEDQPLMMELLGGKKQKIMWGKICDVPVKIKIDSYLPDKIVDLKCMKDFSYMYKEEQGRLPWYEYWGYDIQGAIYQEIVRQNTGKKLPFVLVAVTKETEPDLEILELPQASLDFELKRFKENVVRFDAIKKGVIKPDRCEKCAYCRRTKKITEIKKVEDIIDD